MTLKTLLIAAGFACASATAGSSATIGQPLFIAEDDGRGSILDFFQMLFPSGLKEVTASATVTQQFGSTGFLGSTIDYSMDINGNGTLSLGTFDFDIFTWTAGFAGAFGEDFADTGLISTTFLVEFPVVNFTTDPVSGDDIYTLDLDPFGTGLLIDTLDTPEVEIGVNIFYDGALPTKLFDDGFGILAEYIEGPFTPSRIEVGLVGGVPVAPVPLPATGLLLLMGLGGMGVVRRQRKQAI